MIQCKYLNYMVLTVTLATANYDTSAHVGTSIRIQEQNQRIEAHPDDANLYLIRGELYRENRNWPLAWNDYTRAQMMLPKGSEQQFQVLFYMGRMQLQSGNPKSAHTLLSKVLAYNPNHSQARLNQARTLFALGEKRKAVGQMDQFISLTGQGAPDYYLERAKMTTAIGPEYNKRAIKGLNEAIDRLGPLVSLIQYAVEVHTNSGQYQLALEKIHQLPTNLQELPAWQARYGDILRQEGKQEEAVAAYRKATATINKMPERRRSTRAMQSLYQYLCKQLNDCSPTLISDRL